VFPAGRNFVRIIQKDLEKLMLPNKLPVEFHPNFTRPKKGTNLSEEGFLREAQDK
jgi:hypothetical protein